MTRRCDHPVVYGNPAHLARLLDSTATMIDREPHETFTHRDVQDALGRLSDLVGTRLGETDDCP